MFYLNNYWRKSIVKIKKIIFKFFFKIYYINLSTYDECEK